MRASHGNTHLGGDDFDERLMEHLADCFKEEHGVDPREDRKALARLTRAAEQAKIAVIESAVRAGARRILAGEGSAAAAPGRRKSSRHEFEDLIGDLLRGHADGL